MGIFALHNFTFSYSTVLKWLVYVEINHKKSNIGMEFANIKCTGI